MINKLSFKRYTKINSGEKLFAAEIETQEVLDVVSAQIDKTALLGDHVVIEGNGKLKLYGELDFGETFTL